MNAVAFVRIHTQRPKTEIAVLCIVPLFACNETLDCSGARNRLTGHLLQFAIRCKVDRGVAGHALGAMVAVEVLVERQLEHRGAALARDDGLRGACSASGRQHSTRR